MYVDDIAGARPAVMKGYGGVNKQYEKAMDVGKLNRLPYAGTSSRVKRGRILI